jgi:hypothetical protein
MVINFCDLKAHTEEVVRDVLRFVGASQQHYTYKPLPPAMQVTVHSTDLHWPNMPPVYITDCETMFLSAFRSCQWTIPLSQQQHS